MNLTDTDLFRALLALLLAVGGFMLARIWLNIDRLYKKMEENHGLIDNKLEAYKDAHNQCQLDLPQRFVEKLTYEKFTEKWEALWERFIKKREREWACYWNAFNSHQHDKTTGYVVRRNGRLPLDPHEPDLGDE